LHIKCKEDQKIIFKICRLFLAKALVFLIYLRPLKWDGNELSYHIPDTNAFCSLPFGFSQRFIYRYYEGFSQNPYSGVFHKEIS